MLVEILSLISIALALIWLSHETNGLTIRLPYGTKLEKPFTYAECFYYLLGSKAIEIDQYLVMKPVIPQISQYCELTRIQNELKGSRYGIPTSLNNYHHKTSYQKMIVEGYNGRTIAKTTFTIDATSPKIYDLITEVEKTMNEKHKPKAVQYHLSPLGSRYSYIDQVFDGVREPLCGREWLEQHKNDVYPEPLIGISVIDGKSISVNGNYQKGMIGDFMAQYTEVVRAGKKKMRINKGEQVVNCGGGVYVAEKV